MEEIDWSTEWWRSPVWVLGVWVLVLVGFMLLGWLLVKRTGWGRQFWRLSSMYFIPYERSFRALKPILTVALLLLLTVMSVRLDVLLSFQGNELFSCSPPCRRTTSPPSGARSWSSPCSPRSTCCWC